MRVRIRSSSRVSPCHVSPVGSRLTNTVPGAAPSPMRRWTRCQPGGVWNEPDAPPMPFAAVETGHSPVTPPPSTSTSRCAATSTSRKRSGALAERRTRARERRGEQRRERGIGVDGLRRT